VNVKKNLFTAFLLTGTLLFSIWPVSAQTPQSAPASTPNAVSDQDIQLLRQDIRAQRKQITAANMSLTADEATKFWPIYDQYIQETIKINDQLWALIKDYAANFNTLTDQQAQDYINRAASVDQQLSALRMKYVPIFQKVISAKKTAQWYQIDHRLNLMIDLELAARIPVVNPTK
jgi:hypothetical protein